MAETRSSPLHCQSTRTWSVTRMLNASPVSGASRSESIDPWPDGSGPVVVSHDRLPLNTLLA